MEVREDDDFGVDIDALFAPPSDAELQTIQADWATRNVSPASVEVMVQDTMDGLGDVRSVAYVIGHDVAGVRHYGAIVAPIREGGEELPVLVYNHGGDEGVNVNESLALISLGLAGIASDFVLVIPSFRSEVLTYEGVAYQSEGPASPWDFDVDDALALLNVTLDLVTVADESRLGVLGFSRGGGVSMLMAARDPRIAMVIQYFGPSDFFVDSAREETVSALRGETRDLPGFDFLNENVIMPLQAGTLGLDAVRLEYIRRSPVYFANMLPLIQVHHGELDDIVSVEHARSLEGALQQTVKSPGEYEIFIYPEAGHNFLQMPQSFARAVSFFNANLVESAG